MISQIYLSKTTKFIEDDITNRKGSVLIGQSETWGKIYDPNNTFTLGGSKENPVTYTFTETGITNFIINLIGDRKDRGFSCLSSYEIIIQGDKKYVMYSPDDCTTLMNTTISIYATKGTITNFLLNLVYVDTFSDRKVGIFFKGHPDIVYSSITAQFIPDSAENKLEPIIVKEDTTLKKNRRYLVYALYGKTLQLNLDDEDEFEIGDWIEIKNMEFGKFQLNSMKYDIVMQGKSTKAKKGFIKSISRGDFVRLECLEKSSDRIILSDTNTVGTFTFI